MTDPHPSAPTRSARRRGPFAGHRAPARLGALLIVAVLAGCAGPTPQPDSAQAPDEAIERAERFTERGRPLAAVRIYRDLADEATPPEGQRWRLRVVELLFEHEYPELALEWHEELRRTPVPPEYATRKQIVDAQAAVARRQGVRALRLLPFTQPDMADDVRARILATRADAYRLTGQPALALLARIEREPLLTDRDAIERNHEEIWAVLQSIPADRLERLAATEEAPDLRGWAELGKAIRAARVGERTVGQALDRWRERFAGHPAASRFADALRERVAAESPYPARVALLLPLSGPLADAGTAIRDGLFAAYYAQPAHMQRPSLEVYDTGGGAASAADAYDRAIADGAAFVIGPLAKNAVAAVADRASRDVPILSLNYLPEDYEQPPRRLHQLGLLPEDEARQAAEAAIQNGHYNALVLVPSGNWGERMARAFGDRFDELGGVVLEAARYDADTTDYGQPIQQLLNLDTSHARERRVQSTIGQGTRFDPRRRQDVEMIFAAARPRQARLIKPQLEFHRAGGLPTYATSHAFTGKPDPDSDWDMNGLYFTDTPWILKNLDEPDELHQRITRYWPDLHDRYPRLFALGIDAFSILPHLDRLSHDDANAMAGRTGLLSLDDQRRVHRQLHWAQVKRGAPVPVSRPGAADALDVEALPDEDS